MVVLCLFPENWGLKVEVFTHSVEKQKLNVYIYEPSSAYPIFKLSSAHTGTTVHHEGRTAILIMLSKAKLASVCVPWVSSKEQLAPVCNGRC